MLYSLTMALSENMAKNKNFILKLDLYEKWDKTTLIAYLISASCGKSFGDKTSLTLCLFKEHCMSRYIGLRFWKWFIYLSRIANNADCFLWIRRVSLLASFWSEHPVPSCYWMLHCFLAYCILFSYLQCIGYSVRAIKHLTSNTINWNSRF